jgi:hypothetical protein
MAQNPYGAAMDPNAYAAAGYPYSFDQTYAAFGQGAAYSDHTVAAAPHHGAPGPTPGKGICSYYSTAAGCRKGDRCDFVHPAGAVKSQRESVRFKPY